MSQNPDTRTPASAPGGQRSGSAPDLSTHGRLGGLAQGTHSQSLRTLPATRGPALVDPGATALSGLWVFASLL